MLFSDTLFCYLIHFHYLEVIVVVINCVYSILYCSVMISFFYSVIAIYSVSFYSTLIYSSIYSNKFNVTSYSSLKIQKKTLLSNYFYLRNLCPITVFILIFFVGNWQRLGYFLIISLFVKGPQLPSVLLISSVMLATSMSATAW